MELLVVAIAVIVLGLGAVFWIVPSNEARGLERRDGGDGESSGFTAYNGDDGADGDVGGAADGDGGGSDGGGGNGGGD